MTETSTTQNTQDTTEQAPEGDNTLKKGLHRFVFLMGVLFLFWLMFSQLLPRLFFKNEPQHAAPPAVTTVMQESTATKEKFDALEARIKELETTLATLSAKPAIDQDALHNRIKTVEEKTDALSARPDHSREQIEQLQTNLKQQNELIDALKQESLQARRNNSQKIETLLAFHQMKEKALQGENYHTPLRVLQEKTLHNKEAATLIEQLMVNAEKGVGGLEALRSSFAASIDKALHPEGDGLLQNVGQMVRIRKVGENQQGLDDESVIARAEAKLTRGSINETVQELAGLSPPAAVAFGHWNTQVNQYIRLREMIDALELSLAKTEQPLSLPPEVAPSPPLTEPQETPAVAAPDNV